MLCPVLAETAPEHGPLLARYHANTTALLTEKPVPHGRLHTSENASRIPPGAQR